MRHKTNKSRRERGGIPQNSLQTDRIISQLLWFDICTDGSWEVGELNVCKLCRKSKGFSSTLGIEGEWRDQSSRN